MCFWEGVLFYVNVIMILAVTGAKWMPCKLCGNTAQNTFHGPRPISVQILFRALLPFRVDEGTHLEAVLRRTK